MAKNKMKEKVIDTEPIKDDREEVAEAAQEMVEEQTGDKVTDQAAEEDDKSARMAAAGRTNTCGWWPSSTITANGRCGKKWI